MKKRRLTVSRNIQSNLHKNLLYFFILIIITNTSNDIDQLRSSLEKKLHWVWVEWFPWCALWALCGCHTLATYLLWFYSRWISYQIECWCCGLKKFSWLHSWRLLIPCLPWLCWLAPMGDCSSAGNSIWQREKYINKMSQKDWHFNLHISSKSHLDNLFCYQFADRMHVWLWPL